MNPSLIYCRESYDSVSQTVLSIYVRAQTKHTLGLRMIFSNRQLAPNMRYTEIRVTLLDIGMITLLYRVMLY